ncbi:hypothetical protein LCGC14_1355170 [marine sediment metagenome]|uniref:Radical SAM core domain-containing protein n=1 Tax=marine sediment metagenome TaxID=412755 RepID=A0A0F9KAF6_9ZZZZ|nr:radical SAM protein [Candidatus Aminicenantes bacterium]
MKEITFELTNYCEHKCAYCSSETTDDITKATILSLETIKKHLKGKMFKRIILSGGEPLSHPVFYWIYVECRKHASDIIVYTNTLKHIAYNANIHDGIYIEVALNVPQETSKVRILKRINQGREKTRPEITLSRNFNENCDCQHRVIRPNGDIAKNPCKKE